MHRLLAQLLERHRPAVLLVTHDVDEAILLANRAIVLAPPAGAPSNTGSQIVADLPISVARPRRRNDPAFVELRRQLLGYLGVDEDDQTQAEWPAPRLALPPPEEAGALLPAAG
jgi:sulfonate transport system ATP-binding protein